MVTAAPTEFTWPTDEQFVAGSFRDRGGRVFQRDGEIYRAVSAEALAEFEAVRQLSFMTAAMDSGRLVPTQIVHRQPPETSQPAGWAGALRHERVPLVSWPYEWCFSMLRDAALLQLELMREALAEGAILKDATPYNVQFNGVTPTFIDTASIVRLQPGDVWDGYRQFCQLFLYPLMMQAYVGLDFQPFLRGRLDGITPDQFRKVMSIRDVFRRGVFTHVVLHSRLSPVHGKGTTEHKVSESLRQSGFQKALIENNVRGLIRLIERLDWDPGRSIWSEYDAESEPVRLDAVAKEQFVREALGSQRWKQTWDVGCNLGRYSRIAAEHSDQVVALDSDHLAVDRFCRALKREGIQGITPLVYNPADPSPNMGWRCEERSRFAERGQPDLILFLAVIHHLVIGANLLLPDLIAWLAEQRCAIVIEFVDRNDPQVKSLLMNRVDVFQDYSREEFDRCMSQHFEILKTETLPSGTRTLFFARPRK